MVTVPLVLLLGFLAFAMVKWGGHKTAGVVVGILFGLALASTAAGPPITRAMTALSESLMSAASSAVDR